MSWLFGNRNKKREEAEWIAGLPETVEDDPRLGANAATNDGFEGTISEVNRFPDGLITFDITDGDDTKHGLTSDQITFKP